MRAQTTNGDWISPVFRIPLHIDEPFYLQTWFLLLLGLVLSVGGYLHYRTRKLLLDKTRLEAEVARRTAQIERDKAIIEKQAADLEASAKLKSRFFANVSHEFRTPLMLLLGPIQSLSAQLSNRKAQSLLEVMERNARQLLHLVNDLLDLSKLDVGQLSLNEHPADLSHTVRLVLSHFTVQAQYVGIQLRWVDRAMLSPVPTVSVAVPALVNPSEKRTEEAPANAPTILIVEDNPDMVFYVASIAHAVGYQ